MNENCFRCQYTNGTQCRILNLQESSPYHNLAYAKKQTNGSRESASLLEVNHQLQPQIHQTRVRKTGAIRPPTLNVQPEGPHVQLTPGGPHVQLTPAVSEIVLHR